MCVPTLCLSLYTYVCSYFLGIQQVVGAQHIIDMSLIKASARPPHLSYRKEAECLREGLSQHVPCAFYHGRGMSWKKKDDPNKNTQKVKT